MTSEQRRVVLTLGLCGLVSAADNWFVSPALPAIAQTLAVGTLVCALAPSLPALVAAACLGLGYILVQPTLVSLSTDVDPAQTGLCTGLVGFGVFVGGGVGGTLGGFAISAGGYEALWVAAAVALALQTAIGWRVLPQK